MEYSQTYLISTRIVEQAAAIKSAVEDLKALYANVEKIENSKEFSVLASGIKMSISEKMSGDMFKSFIEATVKSIYANIELKEREIMDLLKRSDKDEEAQMDN
jgi:hypothetical protein